MADLLVGEEHRGKAYKAPKSPLANPLCLTRTYCTDTFPEWNSNFFFYYILWIWPDNNTVILPSPDCLNPSLSFLLQYMKHSHLQVVDGFILYFYCTLELRGSYFYIFIKQSYSGASLSKVRICCFYKKTFLAMLAAFLYGWKLWSVCQSVHYFDPEISQQLWLALKCGHMLMYTSE